VVCVAKPPYDERLAVILVMSFRRWISTNLARLPK